MANTTVVTVPGSGIPMSRVLYFALTVYFLPAIALTGVLIWWSAIGPDAAKAGTVFRIAGGFGDDFDKFVRDLLGPLLIPLVTAYAVTITTESRVSTDTAKVLLSFTLILLASLVLRVVLSSFSDEIDCLAAAARSSADAASCAIPEARAAMVENMPPASGPRISKIFSGILFSYMKEAAGYVALLFGLSMRSFSSSK
jgi:hypothetical protein